jgi:hypothetical protein
MTTRLLTAFLVTIAAGLTWACDVRVNDKGVSLDVNEGGRAADEWKRSYTLPKGGRFELHSSNGTVDVVRSAGAAVEVTAQRTVRARSDADAQALLKSLEMAEDVAGDHVTVGAVRPKTGDSWQRVRIMYRIAMPVDATVSLRTENGRIGLDGVQGRISASVTNGMIDGRGVSGELDLSTVNGAIEMRMAAVTGDVRMSTVNGGVLLFLPPDANGTIDAVTVNGGVEVQNGISISAIERDQRHMTGRLGNGTGPRLEFRTTNGGVRLRPLD